MVCRYWCMIGLEINDAVVLEQKQVLEAALSTNPKTQKALQKLIRQVIMDARAEVVNNIKFDNSDPRQSARAVRTSVYKKILGANINIYNGRKAHGSNPYEELRTIHHGQRGGNRMVQSMRTYKLKHYAPQDRGMILRFVNSGTKVRYTGGRNGDGEKYDKFILNNGGRGHRGAIAARNFLPVLGNRALVKAADILATLIDTELENILNKK